MATIDGMLFRVIVVFLTLALLWSGLSTVEAPRAFAQSSTKQQSAMAHAGGHTAANEGSVEHHHLDDLPSHAQYDPPAETPGLLPAMLQPSDPSLVMEQPRAFVSVATGSPFLAGPLRPPCSAGHTA